MPLPDGATIPIANVRGEISYEKVAGTLEFTVNGQKMTLDALDDEGDLFIIFRDGTSNSTTYPPGRFLVVEKPRTARLGRRLQQGVQPAVRVLGVHDVPAAAAAELAQERRRGGREIRGPQVVVSRVATTSASARKISSAKLRLAGAPAGVALTSTAIVAVRARIVERRGLEADAVAGVAPPAVEDADPEAVAVVVRAVGRRARAVDPLLLQLRADETAVARAPAPRSACRRASRPSRRTPASDVGIDERQVVDGVRDVVDVVGRRDAASGSGTA